ncbi:hypothetical protein NFI96_009970, partial [Prochilodus magdalenae]
MYLCKNGVGLRMEPLEQRDEYTFILRNVSVQDSGNYSCVYSVNKYTRYNVSTSGHKTIQVKVTEDASLSVTEHPQKNLSTSEQNSDPVQLNVNRIIKQVTVMAADWPPKPSGGPLWTPSSLVIIAAAAKSDGATVVSYVSRDRKTKSKQPAAQPVYGKVQKKKKEKAYDDSFIEIHIYLCKDGVVVMMEPLVNKDEYTFTLRKVTVQDSGSYSCVYSINKYPTRNVTASGKNSVYIHVTGIAKTTEQNSDLIQLSVIVAKDDKIRGNSRTDIPASAPLCKEKQDEHCQSPTAVNVSDHTIRNRPHEGGLRARRPVVGPVLTGQHRRAQWHLPQNTRIGRSTTGALCFTDESRFYLSTCDRCDRLWTCRGECYAACNIIHHDWFGGGSVMVCGGISLEGRTDLYRLDNGTLTATRYQDEILGPLVRPYADPVGLGFLLVHNNAQAHVARVCRQFLENEGIDTIDWPTGSPDLNPIEHFWDIMFRSIRRHQVALQTVQELSDALVQIWEEIPQDIIHDLRDFQEAEIFGPCLVKVVENLWFKCHIFDRNASLSATEHPQKNLSTNEQNSDPVQLSVAKDDKDKAYRETDGLQSVTVDKADNMD